MDFLYYSTWLFAEQLRLFNNLALEGCRWWNWSRWGARPFDPPATTCGSAPPPSYFERLVGVAEQIARHASFPDHQEAVQQCLEEVGDLIATGRITPGQGLILEGILLGARPGVV